jgi:hypothetical protein
LAAKEHKDRKEEALCSSSFNFLEKFDRLKAGMPSIMKILAKNILGICEMLALGIVLLITMFTVSAPGQSVIASQTGPLNDYGFFALAGIDVYSVSWTSTGSYSGANISVALLGDSGGTGMAYLTTQIGPGTTLANQVTTASFAFPSASSYVTILSGLSLGAGTYYLTIEETGVLNGAWLGSSSPTVTTAPNVIANGQEVAFYNYPPAYNPADSFSNYFQPLDYIVGLTPIPEPSAAWLIILGGGVMVLKRR